MTKMPDGEALTKEMAKALPLYCYADKRTKQLLMKQGFSINEKTRLKISNVYYMGEAGGITCFIERPDGKSVAGVSATQVCFTDEGEIYGKINAYREARIQWLRQEELKDKMLGCGSRINVVEKHRDGSMKFSVDDGTEITAFPKESSQAATNTYISRNALCPCGSGKRYRKCCGAKRS